MVFETFSVRVYQKGGRDFSPHPKPPVISPITTTHKVVGSDPLPIMSGPGVASRFLIMKAPIPSLGVPDPSVQHGIRLLTSHITHRNPRPGPSRPCQRPLAWNPRGYPWSRPIDNVPGVLSNCTLQVYSPAHSLYTVHNPQMGGTDGLGLLWPHNRKHTRYS